ncbi:MAG: hypothetical protein F4187_00835 [Gemmatimonadetes bacterium]|nr:hypothetical protein [Gemmatimonadota bacterium]
MKEVAGRRPYWRYRHSHASEDVCEEHVAWDGMILRHDDPWCARVRVLPHSRMLPSIPVLASGQCSPARVSGAADGRLVAATVKSLAAASRLSAAAVVGNRAPWLRKRTGRTPGREPSRGARP